MMQLLPEGELGLPPLNIQRNKQPGSKARMPMFSIGSQEGKTTGLLTKLAGSAEEAAVVP